MNGQDQPVVDVREAMSLAAAVDEIVALREQEVELRQSARHAELLPGHHGEASGLFLQAEKKRNERMDLLRRHGLL